MITGGVDDDNDVGGRARADHSGCLSVLDQGQGRLDGRVGARVGPGLRKSEYQ